MEDKSIDEPRADDELNKQHLKWLNDELKGEPSPLTQKFAQDSKLILNQINLEKGDKSEKQDKSLSVPKKSSKIDTKKLPEGVLPHTYKMEQYSRKLNEEYFKQIKQTDKLPKNSKAIEEELKFYQKKVSDIKQVNRDEELLRMQKENQEIEEKLNELKQQDNTELKEKQEDCRKLVDELNVLFNDRKLEAAAKEKEREKAIEQIKAIRNEQEEHRKDIQKLEEDKKNLEKTLENLVRDVESYSIYKNFIDQVNAKYSNDNTNQNFLYDNLKEKFEQLMNHEIEIKKSIEDSEKDKQKIKNEILDMRKKNDKQSQNTKLQDLEREIKEYTDKNKQLEQEIDGILKEKQKKDSDTHQIKLSIFNLYDKVMKEDGKQAKDDNFDMNADETHLCMKLDKINEKIMDLISIHKELESYQHNNNNNAK